ncbi:hypothetical protein DB354_17395 [Opitutus sp. ER46]|nr:hypothetical protein DB354_17395 [Opitutus sp. ER46]
MLLPDGLFFNRAVPISAGATPQEAATQVELALESIAPFPLSQMFYGWYWVPGADHAFVYAAYRRRFTTDQTASWGQAELVAPASAALFGGAVGPATTLLLAGAEGLTAVHWETPQVPSQVVYRPYAPEATEEDRAAVREEVLRSLGGSKTVVDLLVPPVADPSYSDKEITFRSGDFVSRLPSSVASALDVRDKGELEALRAARKRDVAFWRVALGCVAALFLLGVGELALIGGHAWQQVRVAEVNGRAPAVRKIEEAQDLAATVQGLVTKRFLPLEMITAVLGVNAERKPSDVVITRIQSSAGDAARGAFTIVLELETTNPAQVPAYGNELKKLPECEDVHVEVQQSQGGRSRFRVLVTFKPGILKPNSA